MLFKMPRKFYTNRIFWTVFRKRCGEPCIATSLNPLAGIFSREIRRERASLYAALFLRETVERYTLCGRHLNRSHPVHLIDLISPGLRWIDSLIHLVVQSWYSFD